MNLTGVRRHAYWLIFAVIGSLVLGACNSMVPTQLDPVIKIGLAAPFEGRHRDVGYDVIYSARLAIREANGLSGPGQAKYALVAMDDFGEPESARQIASAMAIDPDVVAVIGHWLPETTAAAQVVYEIEGVPFVPTSQGALGVIDPAELDADFLRAYEDVTPFDETAGQYAGSAYDGMRFILKLLAEIEEDGADISRASLDQALRQASHEGIKGSVHLDQ